GSPEGTFVVFGAQHEDANARALRESLRAGEKEDEAQPDRDLLAAFEDDASTITERCEKAVRRFTEIAQGRVLEPKVLAGEIDDLLGLLERLDREGRHKDALRIARELCALLALLLRWLDLVRSLRVALRAARALGDHP